jgi:hypothetical protein
MAGHELGDASLGEIGIPDLPPLFPELLDLDFAECDWMFSDAVFDGQSRETQQQGYTHPDPAPAETYPQHELLGQVQLPDDGYWLPAVSDYDSLGINQNPQQWTSLPVDSQPPVDMFGLTAFPGANDFEQDQPVEHQTAFHYPDPTTLMQPTHPYYTQPGNYEYADLPQVQLGPKLTQTGLYDFGPEQIPYELVDSSPPSRRSISSRAGSRYSRSDYNDSDSDDSQSTASSDSGYSRAASTFSDSNALRQPVRAQPEYRKGETPKKDSSKPWVRVNRTTRGESTRTSKVNNWENAYKYKPLPVGDWQTEKYRFEYKSANGVDLLKKMPMSTRQIQDYIRTHPGNGDKRLIIWIQKTPADSGRRAGSAHHFKCLFKDCPVQRWGDGTIMTGEYRVAFDEKHQRYGNEVDPFDCVAYAHLYCMERFLDFDKVCRLADVRVDVRSSMPKEPKGKAAFSFSGHAALPIPERFVKLATRNMLRGSSNFARYPIHDDYKRGERKPHEDTLVYQLHKTALKHLPDSQREQFARRAISAAQREIHLGDLEIAVAVKKIQSMVGRKTCDSKNFPYERWYDQCDPIINVRIAQRREECAAIIKDADERASTRSRNQKKRKAIELSDDEEEEEEQEQRRRVAGPSRTSLHKKEKRHDYSEVQKPAQHEIDLTQDDDVPSQPRRFAQHYQLRKSPATPKSSCSDLFPRDGTLDIADFSLDQDLITEDDFEKLMAYNNSLDRRASVSLGPSPGIMKSPALRREARPEARPARQACFNVQPVSSSTEYFLNDPPSRVAASPRMTFNQKSLFERRSARLAAITVPGEKWIGRSD